MGHVRSQHRGRGGRPTIGGLRRLSRPLGAAAVSALLAMLLPASVLAAPPPAGDTASGSGVRAGAAPGSAEGIFSFNATSGPSGESAAGWFTVAFPNYASFTADVTCLKVTVGTAVIAGTINAGSAFLGAQATAPGMTFLTVVEDHGGPKHGVSPDTMGFIAWGPFDGLGASTPQQACDDPATFLGTSRFRLTSGNLSVKDVAPVWDTAYGAGERELIGGGGPGILFGVDAHSGPSGENPAGTVTMSTSAWIITGSVTCLRVTGGTAIVTGIITSGVGISPDSDPGNPFLVILEDHGSTRHGVSPDRMSVFLFGTGLPTDAAMCADPDTALGPFAATRLQLLSGGITVKDRRP